MFPFSDSSSVGFDGTRDIPDLSGKVILVTGGNSGLGAETIKQLAAHNPSRIYLCARTRSTAESTVASIVSTLGRASEQDASSGGDGALRSKISILELDLGDFESVRKCAEGFLEKEQRLDLLVLNAGVAFEGARVTKSGYERQFGTNHMGHALLTKLLMPVMLRTAGQAGADVRIVVVASHGHKQAPSAGILFDHLKTPMATHYTFTRYGQSKLANILFTQALATRYPPTAARALTCVSVHPGAVGTGIGRDAQEKWPRLTAVAMTVFRWTFLEHVSVGVRNQLWAATAEAVKGRGGGVYFVPVGVEGKESKVARDQGLTDRLWEFTEAEFREKGFGAWP